MNTSLVRLSRTALVVIALLTLALLVVVAIFLVRVEKSQDEMAGILDLQRRISAFSVASDTIIMHGADPETLAALEQDANEIRADLGLLADDYPDAGNGIRAIERILKMLEVAETMRQQARTLDASARSPFSAPPAMESLLSTMAAHGIALDASVGEAVVRRQERIAQNATWLFGGLAGFAIVFSGVSFLGFSLLHRRVGIPLNNLATTIRSVEAGNEKERAPEDRSDELGAVGRAFNSLLIRRQAAEQHLKRSSALIRLASELAEFGGWRYEIGSDRLEWTDGTARIHDMPSGSKPTLKEGISFFKQMDQERARARVKACLEQGQPFDNIFQLVTAAGREITVRSVGEPEYDEEGQIAGMHGAFQDVTELMQIREQAARRSARLRDVLAAIDDGFFTVDSEWRFTFINHRAYELVDRQGEDLIDHILWEEFPETRNTRFETLNREAISSGESQSYVEYLPSVERWFEVNALPTADGLAVYFRDFTKQQETRERLTLFEEATERLNDMVVITEAAEIDGPDHPRIIYVNAAFERITGYSSEEVLGKTPRILQGPETDKNDLKEIRQALESQSSVRKELVNYTKSGQRFWLELDIVPLKNEKGRATHFVAIERDITHRKRAAQQLAESEERFRLISRASSDVIWDWDIETGEFWLSENYEDIFEKNIETEPQTFDASIARIHPDDQQRIRRSLIEAIEGQDSTWQAEYRVSTGSGQFKTVEDQAFIIRDGDGAAMRMVAGMTDVTEIRALDQQLYEAQKLESIGQLTGGVAHDFNNLLTIILGNADMLLECAPDAITRKLAETTLEAAERGAHLTDSLLAFARRQPLQPEATDVNALIEGSTTLLRKSVEEGVKMIFNLSASDAVSNIDPTRLQSAILNLVLNSGHAIGERGTITIDTDDAVLDLDFSTEDTEVTPGRYIRVSVSDTGSGMSSDVIERAFDPFFTTRAPGEGTGLGLSSVYGFVKQSGGHARIYSEPGEGTTVRLYLPVAGEGDMPEENEHEPTGLKGRGEEILIVEDDDSLRSNVTAQLEGLGYRTHSVSDADEALRVLDKTPSIKLLFTDVVMPGSMNGRDLAEEAKRRFPGLRVLFTSGYSRHALIQNGKLEDGLQLLSKPYRLAELAREVREALES